MLAWTDESGNTGQNVSDEQQPYFWAATLLSKVDIDIVAAQEHAVWLSDLGVIELHGSAIKIEGVEKIAQSLLLVLQRLGTRLFLKR